MRRRVQYRNKVPISRIRILFLRNLLSYLLSMRQAATALSLLPEAESHSIRSRPLYLAR